MMCAIFCLRCSGIVRCRFDSAGFRHAEESARRTQLAGYLPFCAARSHPGPYEALRPKLDERASAVMPIVTSSVRIRIAGHAIAASTAAAAAHVVRRS